MPSPRAGVALGGGYHSPQVDVEVRLNTNESPEAPPASFLAELVASLSTLEVNRYPDRDVTALRSALALHHDMVPGEVFCANGSNEVLQCLLMAFGGPGRSALIFEPTYALHAHIARLTGTSVLSGPRDEDFAIESRRACDLLDTHQPDVVLLCSPNNPTGRSEPRSTIEAILGRAPGLVIVDEAYAQFSPWTATDLLGSHPNLAVVRTFSKTWALAALRLGYVLAGRGVIEACSTVALPYHLDSFKQEAGLAALHHEPEMRERVGRLVAERERVSAGLARIGVEIWPSDANFVLFRPLSKNASTVWHELVERSVLVRDVSSFTGLSNCLRVTIGTPAENTRFLEALGEVLGRRL
ncbi:MAG: histidinol-phosphate transaminase [Acidimicrobiales bacterium]